MPVSVYFAISYSLLESSHIAKTDFESKRNQQIANRLKHLCPKVKEKMSIQCNTQKHLVWH